MTDPIQPLDPQQTEVEESETAREGYLRRCLVALDIFVNVITGGEPDETISSRSARADEQGKLWGRIMSGFLDLFQKDHGADAQAGDVERALTVLELEEQSKILNEQEAPPCQSS